MSVDDVLLDVRDRVATILLNRPGRLNAMTSEMMDELLPAAFARADADDDVRVIVLRGSGGSFCSGGDVGERITGVQRQLRESTADEQFELGTFASVVWRSPKPVVAALEGVVAGGGLALAMASDIRVAATGLRLCAPFILRGLVPDGALTASLVDAVGYATAMDLCLTGRIVGPEESLRLGLVNRYWAEDFDDNLTDLTALLANAPRQAAALTKRALGKSRPERLAASLVDESWFQSRCMRDPDFDEGVASFLEKRPPRFRT